MNYALKEVLILHYAGIIKLSNLNVYCLQIKDAVE
jgi:hypothetical protein